MTNKRLVISLILVSRTLWAKLLNVSLSIFWNHSLVAITPPRGIPLHGWSSSLRLLSLPPFVYTWISIEVTHCVNSSVTWWPQNFNHVNFYESPNSTVCPFMLSKAIRLLVTLVLPYSCRVWKICLPKLKLPLFPSLPWRFYVCHLKICLWNPHFMSWPWDTQSS
jgi:hypothetical protein